MTQSASNDLRWYAIYTKPNEEDRVGYNLMAWQVETFTPQLLKRRYNKFTGTHQNVAKPLFPRYIFARFRADQMLHKVCFTRGVQSVVSFGGKPASIDDEIIEMIRSRIGPDGFVRTSEELRPGDKVVIREGPLKKLRRRVRGQDEGSGAHLHHADGRQLSGPHPHRERDGDEGGRRVGCLLGPPKAGRRRARLSARSGGGSRA